MFNSLRPHGLQHTRLPCPSPTPGACSNTCPSSQWCHPLSSPSPPAFRLSQHQVFISAVFSFLSLGCLFAWYFIEKTEATHIHVGGTVVKNLPANAEDTGDMGSKPGLGRYPEGGNGNPLQYSCLENPIDRGALRATVPWSHKELDTTEATEHARYDQYLGFPTALPILYIKFPCAIFFPNGYHKQLLWIVITVHVYLGQKLEY